MGGLLSRTLGMLPPVWSTTTAAESTGCWRARSRIRPATASDRSPESNGNHVTLMPCRSSIRRFELATASCAAPISASTISIGSHTLYGPSAEKWASRLRSSPADIGITLRRMTRSWLSIACNEPQQVVHRCRHAIMVWRHELHPVRMEPVTATDPHLLSPIPARQSGDVSQDRRLHFGPIEV